LIGWSGDVPEINLMDKVDPAQPLGDYASQPLPAWLSEEEVDYYTGEFPRTGYAGGLNWYRTSTLNLGIDGGLHPRAPGSSGISGGAAAVSPPDLLCGGGGSGLSKRSTRFAAVMIASGSELGRSEPSIS
jgi:hypothetical protein